MIDCETTRALMDAWVDGECEAAEAEGVQQHMATCPACQKEAEAIRATARVLAALPRRTAPVGLAGALRERLAAEVQPAPAHRVAGRWVFRAVAVAAALILVVQAGLLMRTAGRGDAPATVPTTVAMLDRALVPSAPKDAIDIEETLTARKRAVMQGTTAAPSAGGEALRVDTGRSSDKVAETRAPVAEPADGGSGSTAQIRLTIEGADLAQMVARLDAISRSVTGFPTAGIASKEDGKDKDDAKHAGPLARDEASPYREVVVNTEDQDRLMAMLHGEETWRVVDEVDEKDAQYNATPTKSASRSLIHLLVWVKGQRPQPPEPAQSTGDK